MTGVPLGTSIGGEMRLLMWAGGMVVSIGALGGVLGALSNRSARPEARPISDVISGFFAGRTVSLPSAPRRVSSSG